MWLLLWYFETLSNLFSIKLILKSLFLFKAVTTVGILEGVALKNNIQTKFSFQQIIDCSKSTYGCGGGDPGASLKYAVTSGLTSANDYPFVKSKGACKNLPKSKPFSKSFTLTLNGNEQKLMETVAKYGPVGGEQKLHDILKHQK